jgi:nucleoside-diphosphate-sugar epimerase
MRVAIWGAAGAIGHAVSAELARRGVWHRAVGRSPEKLAGLAAAERVAADVADPAGCARAAEGVDAVVYSLGLPYTAKAFAAYPVMMRHAAAAMRAAGVSRLVHISNVYPYGAPRATPLTEDHPRAPVAVKGRLRKEQEDVVLGAGGLEAIVLRLPDFYGPHADLSFGNQILAAATRGKVANLFSPADAPHQFAFTPDVGPLVCDLLEKDGVWGRAYNFAGSGVISQRDFAARGFAAAGRPPRTRAAGPGMVRALGLVWPLMRELAEMQYLFETPVILDDARLRAVLPGLRHTPYDAGIPATVEWLPGA